jgi:biotin-dependent carboxylase-like uncharacterized protein
MALQVLEGGFLASVQDQGRLGYERFGVPVSGAMDWFALAAANHLVGNPWDAAGIEMAMQGARLAALETCLVAVAGPGFRLSVAGRTYPAWMSVAAPAGALIEVLGEGGFWGYLAASGGIATLPVLGSRSTYLRGKFGGLEGRALQPGDVLPLGQPPAGPLSTLAGRALPVDTLPGYAAAPAIEVVRGPQAAMFPEEAFETFFSASYTVGEASDRMGYRLEGAALAPGTLADILSEGLAAGAVQVPGSGQPIVMLADRQTTGGYRKIATVIRADLPVLAQCPPGSSVRFVETDVSAAQAKYRRLVDRLSHSLDSTDEFEYGYG